MRTWAAMCTSVETLFSVVTQLEMVEESAQGAVVMCTSVEKLLLMVTQLVGMVEQSMHSSVTMWTSVETVLLLPTGQDLRVEVFLY